MSFLSAEENAEDNEVHVFALLQSKHVGMGVNQCDTWLLLHWPLAPPLNTAVCSAAGSTGKR